MSYTDAEMLMASQIAYLNTRNQDKGKNVGEVVDSILSQYGTYDSSTGTYTMREGVSGEQKAQFETAQNILQLSEQNNTVSWRHWTVVDSCNREDTSGYYGCLIDTGDGNAIVGCRGSESYDMEQAYKDWVVADVGRLNNTLTDQQADATEYAQYLWKKYQDKYDSFSFAGHSLGGSLATHMAITAPEGMQEKTDGVISFDGPGFSDEYLREHQEQIQKVAEKLHHYEWSWVGTLLNQPDGIDNRVISATDDENYDDPFRRQLHRHATYNVEIDENGNVVEGERGALQITAGPASRLLENSPIIIQLLYLDRFIEIILLAYAFSVADQVGRMLGDIVQDIVEKAKELYNKYVSLVVSGEYEIHSGEITRMTDDLDEVQQRMEQIADQVREVRRTLPYDSASAFYYKNCLTLTAAALDSEGRKAGKISQAADQALALYNKGDQSVAALF